MKLLDIMKKYDRCLVRESAKLAKIYNMILKESASTDEALDEEVCPDCGNDPCTCESEKEEKEDIIPENEFFEAAKEDCKDGETCDECGLIPEEDFIKDEGLGENDMLRNRPHNGHIDDPAGVVSEKENECKDDECDEDEDTEEMISAAEFFAEAKKAKDDAKKEKEAVNEDEDAGKKTKEKPEDTEMMSAAEFFAEADKDDECDETEKTEKKTEEEKNLDEGELNFIPAEDWIQQMKEKNLEESLKSYRRKNHHLFNG